MSDETIEKMKNHREAVALAISTNYDILDSIEATEKQLNKAKKKLKKTKRRVEKQVDRLAGILTEANSFEIDAMLDDSDKER